MLRTVERAMQRLEKIVAIIAGTLVDMVDRLLAPERAADPFQTFIPS